MHARHLASIAGWTAFHNGALVHGQQGLAAIAASRYWTATKSRAQRWMRVLNLFEQDLHHDELGHQPWSAIEVVVEEILLSEMLTRIWGASMAALDRRQGTDEMQAIIQSVHIGQIEARNRALRLILAARTHDESAYDRMNNLRRKVERWTDYLLGQLPDVGVAVHYAFESARTRQFAIESFEETEAQRRMKQPIMLAAMIDDLAQHTSPYPANPTLNREIAAGVLACFPADRFDSTGLPKSARQLWIEKAGADSQLLVDHLVQMDQPTYSSSNAQRI